MTSSKGTLSVIGWFFIPDVVTSLVQNIYYKVTGKPVLRGHAQFQQHRRVIYIGVIAIYLIYSVVDAYWSVVYEGNALDGAYRGLYTVLGVDHRASSQQIKSAYRRLSVRFHPDKVTAATSHDTWLAIKSSYEVLSDPVLRFGYDRLGYNVLAWKLAALKNSQSFSSIPLDEVFTMTDIVRRGLKESLYGYYLVTFVSILFLNLIGYARHARYWRYYILLAAFMAEVTIITRSTPIDLFPGLDLIPFQAIALMRRLLVSVFIGLNQIAPQLQPPELNETIVHSLLDQIINLSTHLKQERANSLVFEYAPFPDERDAIKKRIVEQLLEHELRCDPEVADAMAQAAAKVRK
ncbi:Scj1p [Sugiyamaella lignohabitans]|uniref:Scj1p n=1 Tax=Sugiyamaella lignohabitans TaxID=796027 RepID=A0A167CD46_9ASCO|nr:Scj1p [Sugiyamaella lignohabitans]ANB11532.1 Scj1p [Sugiyamaella lignohabitans]